MYGASYILYVAANTCMVRAVLYCPYDVRRRRLEPGSWSPPPRSEVRAHPERADKGGGIKLPFLRDSFVYFKRTNLGYLYYFCNRATDITVAYAWNETYAGCGANEMISMFHDYFSAFRTGAEHAKIYCDGCPGQLLKTENLPCINLSSPKIIRVPLTITSS